MGFRRLSAIALDIQAHWPKVSPHARPYLDAMASMSNISASYGADSGKSIVLYFLSNARGWTGEDARRIKKELNDLLKAV